MKPGGCWVVAFLFFFKWHSSLKPRSFIRPWKRGFYRLNGGINCLQLCNSFPLIAVLAKSLSLSFSEHSSPFIPLGGALWLRLQKKLASERKIIQHEMAGGGGERSRLCLEVSLSCTQAWDTKIWIKTLTYKENKLKNRFCQTGPCSNLLLS